MKPNKDQYNKSLHYQVVINLLLNDAFKTAQKKQKKGQLLGCSCTSFFPQDSLLKKPFNFLMPQLPSVKWQGHTILPPMGGLCR